MIKLLEDLKVHMALICMGFGLLAAILVLSSWLYGYWSNGLYGTRFEINSCWQGLSACGVGLIGLFKWLVDSSKNSPKGEFPFMPRNFGGYNSSNRPIGDYPGVEPPISSRVSINLHEPLNGGVNNGRIR